MLLIHCPYCGEERPELEFRHAGEAHIARSATITEVGDEDFEAFLYLRTNTKGLVYERWRHVHGCGRFFNAVRDSVTDRFFTTYKAGQPKPDPARFAKAAAAVEPLVVEAAVVVPEPRQQPAAPAKAPRKAATAADVTTEPANDKPATAKPARGKAKAKASGTMPAAEPKPRRKAAATKSVDTTARAPAGKSKKPAAAGIAEPVVVPATPAPASKRTRKTPVKKGEA